MSSDLLNVPDWSSAGRLAARVTPGGPTVSTSGATAAVTRLRRAAQWSEPMLPRLSGLEEASVRAAVRPALVVDRRGAIAVCARILDDLSGRGAPSSRPPRSSMSRIAAPVSTVGSFALLRAVGPRLHGLWDPVRERRVLVAPTVLVTAELDSLDQTEYARWVAVRVGLWGVLCEQAPWLTAHLSHLLRNLPGAVSGLVRLEVLLDELVTCQMDALTPMDISSVRWIRRNATDPMVGLGPASLRHLGATAGDIAAVRARAQDLARVIVGAGAVATLLRSPDHLPTAEEFDRPEAWLDRVGL